MAQLDEGLLLGAPTLCHQLISRSRNTVITTTSTAKQKVRVTCTVIHLTDRQQILIQFSQCSSVKSLSSREVEQGRPNGRAREPCINITSVLQS